MDFASVETRRRSKAALRRVHGDGETGNPLAKGLSPTHRVRHAFGQFDDRMSVRPAEDARQALAVKPFLRTEMIVHECAVHARRAADLARCHVLETLFRKEFRRRPDDVFFCLIHAINLSWLKHLFDIPI